MRFGAVRVLFLLPRAHQDGPPVRFARDYRYADALLRPVGRPCDPLMENRRQFTI
jgi:hypothetical protein